ncbi:MAG: hypothetical protein ACE5J4_02190 [Candidatus Aenigmatarchaeota archaeon]
MIKYQELSADEQVVYSVLESLMSSGTKVGLNTLKYNLKKGGVGFLGRLKGLKGLERKGILKKEKEWGMIYYKIENTLE